MKKLTCLVLLVLSTGAISAQDKMTDPVMIQKIRDEGLNHSKVMETAFYLSDGSGPRLSGSTGLKYAQDWAISRLKTWGLVNCNLEPWGKFGKGWELQKNYAAITAPYYHTIIAIPKAWTPGTNGLISGDVILIQANTVADLDKYKGTLKGKIVIIDAVASLEKSFGPDASRYTDQQLDEMAADVNAAPLNQPRQVRGKELIWFRAKMKEQTLRPALNKLILSENVGLVLSQVDGTNGTVFVTSGGLNSGSFIDTAKITAPPELLTSGEDYQLIIRLLKAGMPVKMEADIKTRFLTGDTQGYNVVAEIAGTDPALKDQLVIIGGHIDSWQASNGATDNAAGSAAMMEVMRILKAVNFNPRRTIRMVLWSSEEQGMKGSRNYVLNHFGDPKTRVFKPEREKVSAYYNLDYGPGKIRGIYLQNNVAAGPVFKNWLAPFKDLGANTVTIRNIDGTDHMAFDEIGIPGFQFIQDWLDYGTRTHHSNQDTYDKLIEDDLKQAATVVAALVYNTAQSDEMIPRKVLPPVGNK